MVATNLNDIIIDRKSTVSLFVINCKQMNTRIMAFDVIVISFNYLDDGNCHKH